MKLNELSPAAGAKQKKKRLGRGLGSGLGKTGGMGHKGQKARAGGGIMPGFEGGQMPLQRRLPKFGFTSVKLRDTAQVRLSELEQLEGVDVSPETLKAAGLVRKDKRFVRIMLSGSVTRAFNVKGVAVTAGARGAIEAAGGKVEA
jgi:large subunit ribosomal protein L15